MNQLMLRRFAMMGSMKKDYIQFEDPEVERICIANFSSDGIGVTYRDAATVTSLSTVFRGNEDIVTFNELEYFTSLTSITAGSSSSSLGAFGGCTSLQSIKIPNNVRTIGAYSFYNCTSLEEIIIPSSVTSLGNYSFEGCTNLVNLTHLSTTAINRLKISGSGNGTGVFLTKSSYSTGVGNNSGDNGKYIKYIIFGNLSTPSSYPKSAPTNSIWRAKGNITRTYTGNQGGLFIGGTSIFLEGMDISCSKTLIDSNRTFSATLHINRNGIPTATPTLCSIGKMTKVYVGDGSSRVNDESVLALYLADTNWSSYSAKLATWYDYNGTYKWYYVTDNLTNCTNTNPDEWPHITRGESYHTQIVAEEGYTLQSVQVQMYEAVDDGTTPATPTDITSSVYDSSTGEINITAVTGNVIITASAS